MAFEISPSPRVRRSPFYDATVAAGVMSFTPYNHMLMPTSYGDPDAEYWRLIEGVAMWDVAVERQVEMRGPDAAKLAQALAPRKVSKMRDGVGRYVALCDHRGVIVNDPILLKLAEDRFWLSIADSDVLIWARAVAGERGLDVEIFEPDVSPLAIQGPKAMDVGAALFGNQVHELKLFQFIEAKLGDIPLMVARSGWSKQGGLEVYLMDGSRGIDLWNLVAEAGKPWDIGPGNPNPRERIESGLLSWGGDTDDETNPFEVRMGRFVDLDCPDDTIGIQALRKIHADGPKRHQLGVRFDMEERIGGFDRRGWIRRGADNMGLLTAAAWSPRLETNIGMCLVSRDLTPDEPVDVVLADGTIRPGTMVELPFL
ncbi:MAG: glycine cleavage T C-terminal barrel domain-containing protein [Pseudomonadota bacterium]